MLHTTPRCASCLANLLGQQHIFANCSCLCQPGYSRYLVHTHVDSAELIAAALLLTIDLPAPSAPRFLPPQPSSSHLVQKPRSAWSNPEDLPDSLEARRDCRHDYAEDTARKMVRGRMTATEFILQSAQKRRRACKQHQSTLAGGGLLALASAVASKPLPPEWEMCQAEDGTPYFIKWVWRLSILDHLLSPWRCQVDPR